MLPASARARPLPKGDHSMGFTIEADVINDRAREMVLAGD
jgi:hypothetical protein